MIDCAKFVAIKSVDEQSYIACRNAQYCVHAFRRVAKPAQGDLWEAVSAVNQRIKYLSDFTLPPIPNINVTNIYKME